MRSALILAGILLVGLQGCQSPAWTPPASEGPHPQSVGPSPTLAGIDAAASVPTDPAALKMISLAKEHLAHRLGVTVGQIALSAAHPARWRDAGLGCPRPGVDYLLVPTPGYRITLQVGGTTYEYHADQGNRVVQCESP